MMQRFNSMRVVCQAGKGFGGTNTSPSKTKPSTKVSKPQRAKTKGKRGMRVGGPPQELAPPPPAPPENAIQPLLGGGTESVPEVFRRKVEAKQEGREDPEDAFAKRLEALRIVAQEKAAAKKQEAAAGPRSVLDEDIYSNPPALSETVFGKEEQEEDGANRRNQIAAALGALTLVAIFLVANSASDLEMAAYNVPIQQAAPLSPEAARDLRSQLEGFEATLATNPKDAEALEGAGVVFATLGEFKRAADALTTLTVVRPNDAEAWRLLGETRTELGEYSKAVDAYSAALKAKGPDFELLQGLTAAQIQAGTPQAAVSEVQALLGQGDSGYGQVELQLLLGRVYSLWKGHGGDALVIYDQLIKENPGDYRGFLAKGVLLKTQQRAGDAERMFLQARFLAPPEARVLVDRLAGQ